MPDAAYSIVVVCEAAADRRTACALADRVLTESIDWFSDHEIDTLRQWRGMRKSEHFLAWKEVPALADRAHIRIHGHFSGEPGAPDARAARRALVLLETQGEGFDAVILIRDSDGDQSRLRGLQQARAAVDLPIVVGLAHPKREAWVIAGFEPGNAEESARLEEVRRELGFDPTLNAEHLDATTPGSKRDAKRILDELAPDQARQEACWTEIALGTLAERGVDIGLAAYLDEVRERLVPLWTGPKR